MGIKRSSTGAGGGGGGWFRRAMRSKKYVLPWLKPGAWRWRRLNFRFSLLEEIGFRLLSVVESVVLVATFCFYFLCCGCHI